MDGRWDIKKMKSIHGYLLKRSTTRRWLLWAFVDHKNSGDARNACRLTESLHSWTNPTITTLTRLFIGWKFVVIFSTIPGVKPVGVVIFSTVPGVKPVGAVLKSFQLWRYYSKAILLQAVDNFNCSPAFRIFIRKLWVLCFVLSIRKLTGELWNDRSSLILERQYSKRMFSWGPVSDWQLLYR